MASEPGENSERKQPWDSTPAAGWIDAVEAWKWRWTGGNSWEKSGTCPVCKHGMRIEKGGGWVLTIDAIRDADGDELLRRAEDGPLGVREDRGEGGELFYVRCNCTGEHPNRPPGITRGCGQAGLIDPPPDRE